MITRFIAAGLLAAAFAAPAAAEDDGSEFLSLMNINKPKARELAQRYIDNAADKWDGSVFCTPEEDRAQARFNAVKTYLESHPDQLWRPQRYLIIQGLRTAFPCKKSES
jgi:hypothetical protein